MYKHMFRRYLEEPVCIISGSNAQQCIQCVTYITIIWRWNSVFAKNTKPYSKILSFPKTGTQCSRLKTYTKWTQLQLHWEKIKAASGLTFHCDLYIMMAIGHLLLSKLMLFGQKNTFASNHIHFSFSWLVKICLHLIKNTIVK